MTARLLLVMLGGALGSGARYLLGGLAQDRLGDGFPWGTLLVNLLGSFAIALALELGLLTGRLGPEARLLLVTGFLGGFTTWSAFNQETLRMLEEGRLAAAALYAGVALLGGLAAGALGLGAARALGGG